MRHVRFLFALVLRSFLPVVFLNALFLNAQSVPLRTPVSRPMALPLQFEENVGQYNLPMQFAVSGASGRLVLEPGGTLAWLVGDAKVRVTPVAGNSKSRPVSDDLQITRRNYYYSIPVPREYTNVRSFGRVRYPEIYPGIDLVYYGSEGQLEYDFEVAPGADASAIALRVEGGTAELHDGDLLLRAGGEDLTIKAPRTYQVHNGVKSEVKSTFSMLDRATFRFAIEAYDSTLPLIIDPAVRYTAVITLPAPFLPTSLARGVAADSLGNVYVSAETNFTETLTEQGFIFGPKSCTVTKINAQGTAIVYQTTLDLRGTACGLVAVDSGGNAYFSANGTITPTPGAVQALNKGADNSFIRLNPSGQVSYATYFGGSGADSIEALTVDSAGDLVVFGGTFSNDFPLKNPLQTTLNNSNGNGYIFSLNATGTGVNFSTYFGLNTGGILAADNANNIYLSGSSGFPAQNAAIANCAKAPLALSCNTVTKFTPAGAVVFSTFVSADGSLAPEGVAVNSAGTVYLGGLIIDAQTQQAQLTLSTVDKTNGSLTPVNIPLVLGNNVETLLPLSIDAADNIYMLAGSLPKPPPGSLNQLLSVTSTGALNFLVSLPNDMPGSIAAGPGGNFYLLNPSLAVNPLVLLNGGVGAEFIGSVAAFSSADSAALAYTPVTLDFGSVGVGLNSHVGTIEIGDYGSVQLTLSDATATGDFSVATFGCTPPFFVMSDIPSCGVDVVFNPTGLGTRTGSLTITSNALTNPTVIPLSGTGVPPPQPGLAFSAMSLNLGDTPVNGNSAPQTVTLTSNGSGPVNFARIDTTGDFIEANTCGISLAIGAQCTISVILHPNAAGARTGTVVLTDDVAGSPQTINLTGNGIAGFFIASQTTNPSITVTAGQSASMQLNLGSSLGFAGAVNLSCSGMPANSTCTVSPSSVQLAANGTTPITISVTTVARPVNAGLLPQGGAPWPGIFTVLAASLLALVLSTFSAGRSRKVTFAGATLLALAFAGCGGGGGGSSTPPPVVGTPNGVFIITVTGTSGTITQSQAISLNVN